MGEVETEPLSKIGRPKGSRGKNNQDLTGNTYNMLTVIEKDTEFYVSPKGSERAKWVCLCECGSDISTTAENLKSGKVWNCGCKKITTKYKYRSAEYNRNSNLKKKYGITLEAWNEMFLEQGSVCAICATSNPRGSNWHTDHCHVTGKIRGILCGWCNTGIGKLQESPTIFRKALEYLEDNK